MKAIKASILRFSTVVYLQVLGSVLHIWDLVWSRGTGMCRKKLSVWVRGAGELYPLLWMYVGSL